MTNFNAIKQIAFTNPAIQGALGSDLEQAKTGASFTTYFIMLWKALTTVGAIMVLIYFLWGALEWITAGGDSGKIEKARNRITQSMLGLLILVSSFVIIGFISNLFFGNSFNILKLQFSSPTGIQTETTEESYLNIKDNLLSLNPFSPTIVYAEDSEEETNQGATLDFSGADIPGSQGSFGGLISKILEIAVIIGALLVFLYLVWGGIEWITAGGDSGKIEKAKNRITGSIIGLIILASVVAIFVMLQNFLHINVLNFSETKASPMSFERNSNSNIELGDDGNCKITGLQKNDGGAGHYCTDNGYAMVKCVGPDDQYDYNHYDPCLCLNGNPIGGHHWSNCN